VYSIINFFLDNSIRSVTFYFCNFRCADMRHFSATGEKIGFLDIEGGDEQKRKSLLKFVGTSSRHR